MITMLLAFTALSGPGSAAVAGANAPTVKPSRPVVQPNVPVAQIKPAMVATTPKPQSVARPVPEHRAAQPVRHQTPKVPSSLRRVASANTAATLEPAPSGFVNAVQIYPFADGVLYRLYASPERITDIALQSGEALVAVASGDTVRWTIGDTTSGGGGSGAGEGKRTHILVKPFTAGLATNLVITTDRRTYHLALTSTAGPAMAALSWSYPQDALIAIRRAAAAAQAAAPVATGLAIEQLRFDYAITGDTPAWRPLRAFDDGRQTFIEFPAAIAVGEAPPLFIVDPHGTASLVNYRMQGRFYVVDRLFDTAELRLGTRHQQVVRIARVADGVSGKRRPA